MATIKPFTLLDWLLVLLILTIGGGARAGYLIVYCANGQSSGPVRAQTDKFPTNTGTSLSPGYGWFRQLDAEAPRLGVAAESLPRFIQAALGTLSGLFYFLFARAAFQSSLVGLFAGIAYAVYPLSIVNVSELSDGVLSSFILSIALYSGTAALLQRGPFSSLLFGLSLAGLCLIRAACFPFAFVAVAVFLLRMRVLPRGWLCSLLAFLGFANGIAPWMVHEFRTDKEPLVFVEAVYQNLWEGNKADGQQLEFQPDAKDRKALCRLEARALVDALWRDPVALVEKRMKVGLSFLFGKTTVVQLASGKDSADFENISMTRIAVAWLLGVFLLAFLGWRWSFPWRQESIFATLAVMWLPVPYLLGHAEALHGPRLPLDGVLIVFAAYALACLFPILGVNLREGPESNASDRNYD